MRHLATVFTVFTGFSLGLGWGPSWTIPAEAEVAIAQSPAPSNKPHLNQQLLDAYGNWSQVFSDEPPIFAIRLDRLTSILTSAQQALAQRDPRQAQLAIDRLAPGNSDLIQANPRSLPQLLKRLAPPQRAEFFAVVDQFTALTLALPPGYNYAQSRGLIASALTYQQLNQPAKVTLLLQQADQTLLGIAVPRLKLETQWRLAESWYALGQPARGQTSLTAAIATLKTLPQTPDFANPPLLTALVNSFLNRGQLTQAEAAARAIPVRSQGSDQRFRVAAAYLKTRQVAPALRLFRETQAQLSGANPGGLQSERGAIQESVIQGLSTFAQAGGVTTATQAARQLEHHPASQRARVWLAIAGEARQQQRPTEAAFALEQFMAAGKQGQQQGFGSGIGSGFGELADFEWSRRLYELSRAQGYQPELIRFITQLGLQSQAAEFLIVETAREKRFEDAKRLIPVPMKRTIEVGVFEVQEDWFLWVAALAAQAGEPQQLIDLSDRALQQLELQPVALSLTELESGPIYQPTIDSFPYLLLDVPPSALRPEFIVLYAIPLLRQYGQPEAADRLRQALERYVLR